MSPEKKNNYTFKELRTVLWRFIKYLFGFWLGLKKKKKAEKKIQKERFKKIIEEIKDGYDEIDRKSEERKKLSEKERLDNIF